MMTTLGSSPPLEVLVRTSGVKRLSDFLTWQVRRNAVRDIQAASTNSLFYSVRKTHKFSSVTAIGQNSDYGTSFPSCLTTKQKCGLRTPSRFCNNPKF
jgi:hypothetical protein